MSHSGTMAALISPWVQGFTERLRPHNMFASLQLAFRVRVQRVAFGAFGASHLRAYPPELYKSDPPNLCPSRPGLNNVPSNCGLLLSTAPRPDTFLGWLYSQGGDLYGKHHALRCCSPPEHVPQ